MMLFPNLRRGRNGCRSWWRWRGQRGERRLLLLLIDGCCLRIATAAAVVGIVVGGGGGGSGVNWDKESFWENESVAAWTP